jgi:hypothetical protein
MSECTITCGYQPGEVPITQATATWVVNGERKSVILLLNLKEVLNLFLGTPFDPSKRQPSTDASTSAGGGTLKSKLFISDSSDLVHHLQMIDRRLACLLV